MTPEELWRTPRTKAEIVEILMASGYSPIGAAFVYDIHHGLSDGDVIPPRDRPLEDTPAAKRNDA